MKKFVRLSVEDARIALNALENLSYDDYPDEPETQSTILEYRRVRDLISKRLPR